MHHTHASSSARRAGKPHHHSVVTRNGDGRAQVRSDSVTYSGVKEHKHASSVNARRRVVVAAVATIALFTAAFATYGSAASRREKRRSCTAVWERMTARRLPSCTAQRLNKAGALADGPIAAACASYAWVEVACGSRHTFAAPAISADGLNGAVVAYTTGGAGVKGVAARTIRVARATAESMKADGNEAGFVHGAGLALRWDVPTVAHSTRRVGTTLNGGIVTAVLRSVWPTSSSADDGDGYEGEDAGSGDAAAAASAFQVLAPVASRLHRHGKVAVRPYEGLTRRRRILAGSHGQGDPAKKSTWIGNPQLYVAREQTSATLTLQVPDACAHAARRGAPVAAGAIAESPIHEAGTTHFVPIRWPASITGAITLGPPMTVSCAGNATAPNAARWQSCVVAPVVNRACLGGMATGVGIVWRETDGDAWHSMRAPVDATDSASDGALAVLPEGRILILFRRGSRWYRAVAPSVHGTFSRSSLCTFQVMPAGYVALATIGDAVVAAYEARSKGSTNLELAASDDEGRTWKHVTTVESTRGIGAIHVTEPYVAILNVQSKEEVHQKAGEDEKDNNKLAVDLDIGHIIVTYAVRSNDDGAPSGIRSAVVTILKD